MPRGEVDRNACCSWSIVRFAETLQWDTAGRVRVSGGEKVVEIRRKRIMTRQCWPRPRSYRYVFTDLVTKKLARLVY